MIIRIELTASKGSRLLALSTSFQLASPLNSCSLQYQGAEIGRCAIRYSDDETHLAVELKDGEQEVLSLMQIADHLL